MTLNAMIAEQQKLIACKNDIVDTMNKSYEGYSLKMNFDELINKYGYDRINQVFAATIMEYEYDGRIRQNLKEWAGKVKMPEQYAQNSRMCQYVIHDHPGLVDVAANNFQKIQSKLPIIENLSGMEYQVLKQHNDFSILKTLSEQPEYIVAVNLKEKMHDKFEWDSAQFFSSWDNAVSCYVDGVVDKPNTMDRKLSNIPQEPAEEETEEFEDELEL